MGREIVDETGHELVVEHIYDSAHIVKSLEPISLAILKYSSPDDGCILPKLSSNHQDTKSPVLNGCIILIRRGVCSFREKLQQAQALGAVVSYIQ